MRGVRQMPFAKRALATGLLALGSQAAVWPGHVDYPLGLLDGTDGFRVTADLSTGRLGYSVSGVGVSDESRDLQSRMPSSSLAPKAALSL